MVEVAQASLHSDREPKLLILDEPTSALGKESADNLFRYLRHAVADGLSCILISHRIGEVLENVDRVVVMRNGKLVAERPTAELTEEEVIALMGATTVPTAQAEREALAGGAEPVVVVNSLTTDRLRGVSLQARPGEIIGLAGLDGQGQRELLLDLWRSRRRLGHRAVRTRGRIAFVTGDRQAAGLFPLWPVIRNLSIAALFRLGKYGLINPKNERRLTAHWVQRLAVKGSLDTPVPDLSGGTQQKVLVARALAVGADIVLLDDPFRGVDVGTKREIYRLLRDEALDGRCFVWFTTENAELKECDRVYVFHEGRIVADLQGAEITEERVIAASFSGQSG
jgi:ribose transport system ATP-binding protein